MNLTNSGETDMAGDWIKIEHALPTKPEVMQLAALLECEEATVVGYLVVFWTWCDRNLSQKCPVARGTKIGLDRVVGRAGFCDAMQQVGWLLMDGDEVSIPNYDVHLSQSAKTRGVETRRKQQARTKSGTETGQTPDRNRTDCGTKPGPEKRREEKKDIASAISVVAPQQKPKPSRAFVAPTVEEVRAYCTERANAVDPERFVDHYAARGWVMSNGRQIKDWQACVRTWEKNDAERRIGSVNANANGVLPAAGIRPVGGIAGHEQARQDANRNAIAGFLQRRRLRQGDVGSDQPQENVGVHGRTGGRLALRLEEIPGQGAESVGGRTGGVGDAIPGACRPIQALPAEDASGLRPDGRG